MTSIPPVFNFDQWIADHADQLKPPVNNKQTWEPAGDFIVQIVGGPNQRTDHHQDPYAEWFFQYRGNMHVDLMTDNGPKRVDIREGEMWSFSEMSGIPRNVLKPVRSGIVVERIREEGTLEKFAWFCPHCSHKVHEVELQVRDIVQDLPPVFEEFYNSETGWTCDKVRHRSPRKGLSVSIIDIHSHFVPKGWPELGEGMPWLRLESEREGAPRSGWP